MRIIAGKWRGRVIVSPEGRFTRPTADRARETLFSMLISRIGTFEGLRVADLYAGSGALGLEALSRGAAQATFVENEPSALAAIRQNIRDLEAQDRVEIRPMSAAEIAPAQPFDLIFADPPYADGSGSMVVKTVRDAGWLAAGGWMAVETARRDRVEPGPWSIDAERPVGRALITLLRA